MNDVNIEIPQEISALLGITEDSRQRSFFPEIIRFADRAGMTDSQIYNAVGLNRSLWYRMRDDINARTKKSNVLKLVIVLRLSFWEAFYLIALAGYSFTPGADGTDKIIASCLIKSIYEPDIIDEMLYDNRLKTLFTEKD